MSGRSASRGEGEPGVLPDRRRAGGGGPPGGRSSVPEPAPVPDALRTRALAAVFIAGPLLASLTVALSRDPAADEAGQYAMAALAFALGVAVLLRGPGLPLWATHATLAAGTLLLTGFIYFHHHPTSVYPLFYAWLGLYAFYFFRPREAAGHMALIAAAFGAVQAFGGPRDSPFAWWIVTVATPVLTGVVVARLLGQLRSAASGAAARAGALEESERRTSRILETAHDAFIAMDADGFVTGWNPAAEATFGWRAEEAVGRQLAELIIPESLRPAHYAGLERFVRTGEATILNQRLELTGVRRDGSEFPVELTIAAARTGDSWRFNAFLSDITERRRLQEERAEREREHAARAEAEALARRVARLQELTDAAFAHLSVDDLLDDLVGRICAALSVDFARILLVDEETGELVVRASMVPFPRESAPRMRVGEGFAGRVAAERAPVVIHDPDPAAIVDPDLRHPDLSSLVGVPLISRDRVVGVMDAGALRPRRFEEDDLTLLRLAAQRVAIGLEHALLYERERRIAETLQRSLLPSRLPDWPGIAVEARYVPAAAEADVGGDWYDVVDLPGGRIAVALGDVEGKGIRAASAVGQLRSAFRAYALEDFAPADIAGRLNRLLLADGLQAQPVTLCILVFEPDAETLTIARAGHPPPLVLAPDGTAGYLERGGSVPLGVMARSRFTEETVRLETGSAVLVFTDGLVERRDESVDRGLDRLREALAGPPAEPAALATVRRLVDRLLAEEDVPPEERHGVKLAASEACANAIEHAYGPKTATFEVDADVVDGELTLRVHDQGAWRGRRQDDAGRGLTVIEATMDSLEVRPGERGTTVEMRRRLRVPAPR